MNKTTQETGRAMLSKAARLLLPLHEDFVFLGGMAMALLVSDPAAPEMRPTEDVDVIVEVSSYGKYSQWEEKLRENGFIQPREEAGIICRWIKDGLKKDGLKKDGLKKDGLKKDGLKIDIMPIDAKISGFSNPWYVYAMKSASTISLAENSAISLVSAPCFLATKMEAFQSGTRGDFLTSRDLEDVVGVLDGRPEVVVEVQAADPAVQAFLAETFASYLKNEDFLEALEALLYPDAASQARRALVLSRMTKIAEHFQPSL